MVDGDGRVGFFKGVAPSVSTMLQWKATCLRAYEQHKPDFSFFKEDKKLRVQRRGRLEE